jgi:hypothetical protein
MGLACWSMKILVIVLLSAAVSSVHAFELFGIDLQNASQEQLRKAVKNSGIRFISEVGGDVPFDVYDSSPVFKGSTRLFLGYLKDGDKFAFAEYEFSGLQQSHRVLSLLTKKYGKAKKSKGLYLSDEVWGWQIDSINISLQTDWRAYKTRLIYRHSEALEELRQEQARIFAEVSQQKNKTRDDFY